MGPNGRPCFRTDQTVNYPPAEVELIDKDRKLFSLHDYYNVMKSVLQPDSIKSSSSNVFDEADWSHFERS